VALTKIGFTLIKDNFKDAVSGSSTAQSSSFSTRVTTAETELENTLLSGSAQIATNISGSLGANATVIRNLSAPIISGSVVSSSDSVSARVVSLEGSGTIQGVGTTNDVQFTNITGSEVSSSTALFTTATIDKIGGTIDFNNENMTNVDIDSGTITGITDLTVADGGTGVSTLTDGGVLLGSGAGAITAMSALGDSEMIVGDGTTDPVAESGATLRTSIGVGTTDDVQFTNITGSSVSASEGKFTTVDIDGGTINGITDLAVADGGTGVSTLTDGGVLLGSGTSGITAMSVLADSEMIVGDGSTDPVAESGATLRTSIGVGLTDNVVFSNVSGAAATFNSATVNGLLTVEEIHTVFVSASVTVATGSNIFGDAIIDVHQFTGSIDQSGSLSTVDINSDNLFSSNITGSIISGSTALLTTATIDKIGGAIDFDNQNMTNVDIDSGTITGITDITVADGGTGVSTLTDGGVLLGNGAGAIQAMAVLTDGQMIVGDGTTDPVAESGATLRTSIGVGLTDDVVFSKISGSDTTLTGHISASGEISSSSNIGMDGNLYVGGVVDVAGISLSNNDAGSGNTIFGKNAGASLDAGSNNNVFIGENVSDAAMNDAVENTAVGYSALSSLTTGDENTMIGRLAGRDIGSGAGNVMIGSAAGYQAEEDVAQCVIIGRGAFNGVATDAANGTVAIGYGAGAAVTTAAGVTLVGYAAGDAITTGNNNTAIGRHALGTEDTNAENTAVGFETLKTQNGADGNTAVGFRAGLDLTSGGANTFVGAETAANVTTGADNVMMGKAAGVNTQTASGSVLIGRSAGRDISTGNENIAIGKEAMFDGTVTGDNNIAIGTNAGDALTSGFNNVAIGKQSFTRATTANENVAIGNNALGQNTYTSSGSVAIGYFALGDASTGAMNVGIGYRAGKSILTGHNNVIIGEDAGLAMTSGADCVIIGRGAAAANNTRNGLVIIGAGAGASLTSGDTNTFIGFECGASVSTGDHNTLVGYNAGKDLGSSASHNTLIGKEAGANINSTGDGNNTCLGSEAGDVITNGVNNVIIGAGCDTPASDTDNCIVIGVGITSAGGNDFSFGKASNVVKCDFDTDAVFERNSDERKKQNIKDDTLGLEFINDLRTVTYKWKPAEEHPEEWHAWDEDEDGNKVYHDMNTETIMHGMIAQEVKAALDTAGVDTFKGWGEKSTGQQLLATEMFVFPLIKAVQELSSQVTDLKKEIEDLKN
jgi:hypothetical protein